MTQTPTYDVLGIGNAIVDVIAPVDEAFLQKHSLIKGSMALVDEARSDLLYAAFPPAQERSGGSAANTLAGLASFGGKGAFAGKVAEDVLGHVFTHDMRNGGVAFDVSPLKNGPSTARCLVAVTPDGERTMSTCLGAATYFSEDDIEEDLIRASKIVYLEGYLFDKPEAQKAFIKAARLARKYQCTTSVTLSDSFFVERHREAFLDLVHHHCDLVFANEAEIMSLYETQDFQKAIDTVRQACPLAVITRGEKGAVVVQKDSILTIQAYPVDKTPDLTGAGDQFAAGFLYGLSRDQNLQTCGELGALAASEVISHYGPRPEQSLKALAHQKLRTK